MAASLSVLIVNLATINQILALIATAVGLGIAFISLFSKVSELRQNQQKEKINEIQSQIESERLKRIKNDGEKK